MKGKMTHSALFKASMWVDMWFCSDLWYLMVMGTEDFTWWQSSTPPLTRRSWQLSTILQMAGRITTDYELNFAHAHCDSITATRNSPSWLHMNIHDIVQSNFQHRFLINILRVIAGSHTYGLHVVRVRDIWQLLPTDIDKGMNYSFI
jgi:hypothetical protein